MSLKNKGKPNHKVYYFLVCKNQDCKLKGIHYSREKIENKLSGFLNELTRYIYDINNEIMTCSSTKNKDIENIEKAIEKLKSQEKRLVDLYLSSSINVDAINQKNDMIKKEIIQRLISYIEIKRDTNYEIEVTNIKFSEDKISNRNM